MAALLELRGVRKTFAQHGRKTVAVRDVSLSLAARATLGLVGESGCGKSTLGRLAVGLYRPDAGQVLFDGRDLAALSKPELRQARRRFQMVFQDPLAALSPRMAVGRQVSEIMAAHIIGRNADERRIGRNADERRGLALELLRSVDLDPELYGRLPFELSGGQRQRVLIAKALAPGPDLLISDEPVASLDLSMQARALKLMHELVAGRGMAHLLISHDIRVIKLLAEQVHVMYAGRIVERGPLPDTLDRPAHPYTEVLAASVPGLKPHILYDPPLGEGEVAVAPDQGCPFAPRCRKRLPRCAQGEVPELAVPGQPGHTAACWLME